MVMGEGVLATENDRNDFREWFERAIKVSGTLGEILIQDRRSEIEEILQEVAGILLYLSRDKTQIILCIESYI